MQNGVNKGSARFQVLITQLGFVIEHGPAGGIGGKASRLGNAIGQQLTVLGKVVDFVLLLISLGGEYRGGIAASQVVKDPGLDVIANGRAGGRYLNGGFLNRGNTPISGNDD